MSRIANRPLAKALSRLRFGFGVSIVVLVLATTIASGCGDGPLSPTSPTQTSTAAPAPPPPLTSAPRPTQGPRPTSEHEPNPEPGPDPTPAPSIVSLTGIVASVSGARLSSAIVTVLDGPNSGRVATTNSNGEYRFDNLQAANGNFGARATGYQEDRRGTYVDGTAPLNFTLQGPNFTGTWRGEVYSTSCSDDGVLDGICEEIPPLGFPLLLTLNQSGTSVTGSVELGGTWRAPASGAVQGDRLVIAARGEFIPGANGIQMGYEDWNTSLSGSNMVGSFTWRLFPTASRVRGAAKWTFALSGVSLPPATPGTPTAREGPQTSPQALLDWAAAALRDR